MNESTARPAHPPTEDQDHRDHDHHDHHDHHDDDYQDQDQRPCVCNGGWITLGQIIVDPETGEETEEHALYLCRRCAERS